jgi:hypothetical protein
LIKQEIVIQVEDIISSEASESGYRYLFSEYFCLFNPEKERAKARKSFENVFDIFSCNYWELANIVNSLNGIIKEYVFWITYIDDNCDNEKIYLYWRKR